MTAKKMADIFFGKFSELIEPQSKIIKSDDKIEKQDSIKKKDTKLLGKTLTYLLIAICLTIAGYYFLA